MKELVKLRGNQDEIACTVVIERPDPKNVAGTEERVMMTVPNREGEIPQNADWGVLSPLKIRLQDEFGVAAVAERGSLGFERLSQIFAIVDAAVEHEAYSTALVATRLTLVEGFRRCAEHAVT
jgi:hypothetical protein